MQEGFINVVSSDYWRRWFKLTLLMQKFSLWALTIYTRALSMYTIVESGIKQAPFFAFLSNLRSQGIQRTQTYQH